MILGKYLNNMFNKAAMLNKSNIESFLDFNPNAKLVDLGCDDGKITMDIANKIGTKKIYGVDIVEERIKKSEEKGIIVKKFDLNGKFVFPNDFFDVIHANQVIEHICDSDNFLSEIYRTLKHGGYAVISTENASSWCNIFASIMGWQIFSLTNFSNKKKAIGNPIAIHRNDKVDSTMSSWSHVRIYNIKGLKEYFEVFGFKVVAMAGAGYFPLPPVLGKFDKNHSHFITFKVSKL